MIITEQAHVKKYIMPLRRMTAAGDFTHILQSNVIANM